MAKPGGLGLSLFSMPKLKKDVIDKCKQEGGSAALTSPPAKQPEPAPGRPQRAATPAAKKTAAAVEAAAAKSTVKKQRRGRGASRGASADAADQAAAAADAQAAGPSHTSVAALDPAPAGSKPSQASAPQAAGPAARKPLAPLSLGLSQAAALPLPEVLELDAAAGFGNGQQIFDFMKGLADQADKMLPQEEPEQKKRGRGRQKKDTTLLEALHESWNGKSYYERLQEWSKQEAGSSQPDAAADEADAATAAAAAGPAATPAEAPYRPTLLLGAGGRPATDDSVAFFDVLEETQDEEGQQQEQQQEQQQQPIKRRRGVRGATAAATASTAEVGGNDAGGEGNEGGDTAPVIISAATRKRRATNAAGLAPLSSDAAAAAAPRGRRTSIMPSARQTALHGEASMPTSPAAAFGRTLKRAAPNAGRRTTATSAAGTAADSATPHVAFVCPGAVAPSTAARSGMGGLDAIITAGPAASMERAARAGVGVGAVSSAAAGKAEKLALAKLQGQHDAKCEELAQALRQLKESQEAVREAKQEGKLLQKQLTASDKAKQEAEKKLQQEGKEQQGLQQRLQTVEALHASTQEQLDAKDRELKAAQKRVKQVSSERDEYKARCERGQVLLARASEALGGRASGDM